MRKIAIILLAGTFAFSSMPTFAQGVPAGGGGSSSSSAGTWGPWVIMGCAGAIITAAAVKSYKRKKELTQPEAWTCGLQYWWNEATGKYGSY